MFKDIYCGIEKGLLTEISSITMDCADIIEINVGGTNFTTTDQTLNKLEYFRVLFQSENLDFPEIIRDKNG